MNDAFFYLPLGPDSELGITITHREFNGIDSDPHVIETAPSYGDLQRLLVAKRRDFQTESILSHIADRESQKNTARPGLAGGSGAFRGAPAPDGGTLRICTDTRPFSEWPEFVGHVTPFDRAQLDEAREIILQSPPQPARPAAFEFFQGYGEFSPVS